MRRRKRMMAELDRDIREHIERETQDNIERGMSPEEARRAALLKFGNVALVKEDTRAVWTTLWLEELWRDVRYGVRMLRKSPGFTVVAILTLALGIGANTAIFSLVDGVMFRTLPVRNPRQLVIFMWHGRSFPNIQQARSLTGCPTTFHQSMPGGCTFPYPVFERIRPEQQSFSGMFAYVGAIPVLLSFRGHASRAQGALVSGDFFSTLGVRAAIGRTLQPSDDSPTATPAIVLSHGLWERRFGADPRIIGKTVFLSRHPATVVGVAAPGFFGLNGDMPTDFWAPLALAARLSGMGGREASAHSLLFSIWGRLRRRVSAAQAQAVTDAMFVRDVTSGADAIFKRTAAPQLVLASAAGGLDSLRQDYSRTLLLLMILTGTVLLLASANVAGLALARSAARQKEIAIRLAIGASRWRVIRQLFTESLLLAGMGGAAGVLLSYWGASSAVAFFSANSKTLLDVSSTPLQIEINPDLRVLAFAAVVSALAGTLAGLIPAIRATRLDLTPALKESASAWSGAERGWRRFSFGGALVVGQAALSILILACAALLVRSVVNREAGNVGFPTKNLLTFSVDPTLTGEKDQKLAALYGQLRDRLSALPGVASVTYSSWAPMTGFGPGASTYRLAGRPFPRREWDMSNMLSQVGVGPSFFKTLGIAIVAGRAFNAADFSPAAKLQPVIVNQEFVRQAFGKQNPLGSELADGVPGASRAQIVGVAHDTSYNWPLKDARPRPVAYFALRGGAASFEIRTVASAETLIPAVRQVVDRTNSELVPTDMGTVTSRIDKLLYQERLIGLLSALFALLALLLACVGLYGLLAWEVARRTHEMGIRMALGAERESILRMLLLRGARLALVGTALGLALALGLTRLMRHFLFGVSAADPLTYLGVAVLFLLVALVACYFPARRAMRVDPAAALRNE